MAIRLPMTGVLDITQTDNAASVAGGWAYPFKLPQDTDNVLVKFTASVVAGGASVTFQTSDDGGTTYYDVARTSIVSNNGVGTAPQWLSIPTVSNGSNVRASIVATGSVIAVSQTGTAAASTLSSGQYSGLPIMGLQNRVFVITTGAITTSSARVQVLVNNQSATA